MWEDAPLVVRGLQEAAQWMDMHRMTALAADLTGKLRVYKTPYPEDSAILILKLLRNKRLFGPMVDVADALINGGQAAFEIRRQYAQAFIDSGRVELAIFMLEKLVSDTTGHPEHAEAKGLLGRAYKQQYVNAGSSSAKDFRGALEAALSHYYERYEAEPKNNYWHGINVVALLRRGQRDGVDVKGYPNAGKLAEDILATITFRHLAGKANAWDFATAAEACLALDRPDDVLRWLDEYVRDRYTDAFEIGSTLRQFEEVWQLSLSSDTGARILIFLRSHLLQKLGGGYTGLIDDVSANLQRMPPRAKYEAVLGEERYVSVDWYTRGLELCQSVGRVDKEFETEKGHGTGFLLNGSLLEGRFGEGPLFLTNAHVVSDNFLVREKFGAVHPDAARVCFTQLPSSAGRRYEVKQVWTSPPLELDATILQLTEPVRTDNPIKPAFDRPNRDGKARVIIIGHPKGGPLSFSLNDNLLIDYDDRVLHYRAPTEGGSSGSPVFNQNWQLLGYHHTGGPCMDRLNGKPDKYAANEGVWLDAIRRKLSTQSATP